MISFSFEFVSSSRESKKAKGRFLCLQKILLLRLLVVLIDVFQTYYFSGLTMELKSSLTRMLQLSNC